MENLIKMDDLGVPLFLETPSWNFDFSFHLGCTKDCLKVLSLLRRGVFGLSLEGISRPIFRECIPPEM